MAEIQTNNRNKRPGVKKIQKNSTKVDLTPMVDLGFLLLTFFVFTTTLSKPNALAVRVPNDLDPRIKIDVCNSCVLTVIPTGSNSVLYYEGAAENDASVKFSSFDNNAIREIILEKKRRVTALNDPKKEFVLAIKPADDCDYRNFVNVLDEVTINNVKHYFIAKPDDNDRKLLPGAWN